MDSAWFRQGLMPVQQLSMVDRYNACLLEIGLPKTYLTTFQVDGWGWSPEIAEEQGRADYLSLGAGTNPYAILLSPAQNNLPVYQPFHSFDQHLMKVVFQAAGPAIADLSASTGIWMELDREIAAFRQPSDLLMVDAITLRFHAAGGLMQRAWEQRDLVHQFNNKRNAWADRNLLQRIADSVRLNGDLRYRSLTIPELPYTHTRAYFTRAFGGLYLFRDLPGGKPLLVMEDASQKRLADQPESEHLEWHLHDSGLLNLLYQEQLVDLQWTLYRDDTAILRRWQLILLMRAIHEDEETCVLSELSDVELRRRLQQLSAQNKIPELYHELDRVILSLQKNQTLQLQQLSPELSLALTHPHRSLPESAWNTVRQLLLRLSNLDLVRLYEYDKAAFFEQFRQWKPAFQDWVGGLIRRERQRSGQPG